MTRQQLETGVIAVLAVALKCEVTADSSRKNTPRWDSLRHIEVIFALEDEFGLQYSEEDMADFDSVRAIVDGTLARHAT